jgi:hypothetical protein
VVDPPVKLRGVGEILTGSAFVALVCVVIVWTLVAVRFWR